MVLVIFLQAFKIFQRNEYTLSDGVLVAKNAVTQITACWGREN